jgi:Flp pilus assembly protein TadG
MLDIKTTHSALDRFLRHMISRRSLLRQRAGAGALEFVLCAPVFFLMLGMLLENGLILFQQAILDNAVADASRMIRTGSLQMSGGSGTTFITQVCNDVSALIPCANLTYNVQSAASFAAISTTVNSNGHGFLTGTGFSPGTAGQDVFVQVAWDRPYYIPWVGNAVNPGGTVMMVSTAAFTNEFYQ